jgi:hypothetical protein
MLRFARRQFGFFVDLTNPKAAGYNPAEVRRKPRDVAIESTASSTHDGLVPACAPGICSSRKCFECAQMLFESTIVPFAWGVNGSMNNAVADGGDGCAPPRPLPVSLQSWPDYQRGKIMNLRNSASISAPR